MTITDETISSNYATFELHPDNEYYATQRDFDQYWNKDIIMGVDRDTKEVLQIGVMEDNDTSSSAMGIKRGSSIDDVTAIYGENYFTYEDSEQTIYLLGYVDHHKNLLLSFVHFEGKVTSIHLSYAFNRLKWG